MSDNRNLVLQDFEKSGDKKEQGTMEKNDITRASCVFSAFTMLMLVLTACDPASIKKQAAPGEPSGVQNNFRILAEVNGTPIYQEDLDEAVRRSLGSISQDALNGEVTKKVLESLIGQRALAQAAEKEATQDELAEAERQVRAYREELLVKLYLQKHVVPEPVSATMVEDYYKSHPEEFAGVVRLDFEYISTTRELSEEQRSGFYKSIEKATYDADWGNLASGLMSVGIPVEYKSSSMNLDLIEEPLRALLSMSTDKTVTPVKQLNRRYYIAKLHARSQSQIKPLAEVSNEIRQKLAPAQMRTQVKKALDDVVSRASIVRH